MKCLTNTKFKLDARLLQLYCQVESVAGAYQNNVC